MWPYDQMNILEEVVLYRLTEDGRCIQFAVTEDMKGRELVAGEEAVHI